MNARVWVTLIATALGGCASEPEPAASARAPPGPRVYFNSTRGQSAAQQDRDARECNGWAVQQSGFDPSLAGVPPHLRFVAISGPPPEVGGAVRAPDGAAAGEAARPQASAANGSVSRQALLEEGAGNYRRALTACLEGRGYTVQ